MYEKQEASEQVKIQGTVMDVQPPPSVVVVLTILQVSTLIIWRSMLPWIVAV